MTTIRLEGHERAPPSEMMSSSGPYVYSLPLHTTSAINIQLHQDQYGQPQSQVQAPMQGGPSASMYISANKCCTEQPPGGIGYTEPRSGNAYTEHHRPGNTYTEHHRPGNAYTEHHRPGNDYTEYPRPAGNDYTIVVNTDDKPAVKNVHPIHVANISPPQSIIRHNPGMQRMSYRIASNAVEESVQTSGTEVENGVFLENTELDEASVYVAEAEPNQHTLSLSLGSEPDSARGSIPDDNVSVNSSGSLGTSGSLTEGLSSLNIIVSADGDAQQHQKDFIYSRLSSLNDSMDSQFSNYGSMASPTSAAHAKKAVKFSNTLPLSWDDDDTGSDNSLDTKLMDASAFILDEFTDEESRTMEDAESLKGTRVALYKGEVLTAMIKVKCSSEEMGYDMGLLNLLHDILQRCDQLGRKMKGSAVRLTPIHLNKMRLSDGRPSKEKAAEVARVLGGALILCEAVCQKHADRLYVATEIKDTVYEKGNFKVGKLGILCTLWKKHKYSVAAEFSGPLCDHIHFYRPRLLGTTSESALKRKRKGTDTVRHVFQSRDLLSQMFKTDPTISIAEAARRSFVEVIFFALYE